MVAPTLQDTSAADPLLEMQLKIARRADEYAREMRAASSLNLQCWLLAEAELLGWPETVSLPPRG